MRKPRLWALGLSVLTLGLGAFLYSRTTTSPNVCALMLAAAIALAVILPRDAVSRFARNCVFAGCAAHTALLAVSGVVAWTERAPPVALIVILEVAAASVALSIYAYKRKKAVRPSWGWYSYS